MLRPARNRPQRRRRWEFESLECRSLLAVAVQAVDDNPDDVIEVAARADVPAVEARRDAAPRRPLARPFEPRLRVDRPARTRIARQIAARAPAALAAAAPEAAAAPSAPVGDLSGDGKVDRADAAILAANFGLSNATPNDGDLSGDGVVGLADIAAIRFGPGSFQITAPLGSSNDDTPDAAWTASPGAVRYDATLETAAGCTGNSIVESMTGITETQAAFAQVADGTHHVCIRAYDEFGNPTDAMNNGLAFTVSTTPPGSLSIDLVPNRTSVTAAGQVVTFTYTVRNTSDVPLENVSIVDGLGLSPMRQPDTFGNNDAVLDVDEIWRYTANYTVTQADLNTGRDLVNSVTADSDQSPPAADESFVLNLFNLPNLTVGDVHIRPIVHASFVFTYQGMTIYVDPDAPTSLYTGIPKADLLIVTHNHGDHYDTTAIASVVDAETRFVVPQLIYNASSFATWRAAATVLGYGQSTDVLGVNIQAVHAYNSRHPLNDGNGYIITVGGERIYASGDTGAVPEIRVLADIDVAFLCMNVPFTMTVDEAASVTRDMRPGMVIPYHYQNMGGTFADLARFKTLVGRDLGIEVRLLDWY